MTVTGLMQAVSGTLGPPSQASNFSPADVATRVALNVTASWNPANGATGYDVYGDTFNPPTTLRASNQAGTSFQFTVDYGQTFYWKVNPKNSFGTTTGSVLSFSTLPIYNVNGFDSLNVAGSDGDVLTAAALNTASELAIGTWSEVTFSVAGIKNLGTYKIETVGTTNYVTAFGSADNNVGTTFVANADGSGASGSGTVSCPLQYVSGSPTQAGAPFIATTATNAGSFVSGQPYQIASVGTTDFTLIGASANTVGLTFTATGAGSGSGNAKREFLGTGLTKAIKFRMDGPNNSKRLTFTASAPSISFSGYITFGPYAASQAAPLDFIQVNNGPGNFVILSTGNTPKLRLELFTDAGSVTSLPLLDTAVSTVYRYAILAAEVGKTYAPTAMVIGHYYSINTVGTTTNWTSLGAPDSNQGTCFKATAVGTGNGVAGACAVLLVWDTSNNLIGTSFGDASLVTTKLGNWTIAQVGRTDNHAGVGTNQPPATSYLTYSITAWNGVDAENNFPLAP